MLMCVKLQVAAIMYHVASIILEPDIHSSHEVYVYTCFSAWCCDRVEYVPLSCLSHEQQLHPYRHCCVCQVVVGAGKIGGVYKLAVWWSRKKAI